MPLTPDCLAQLGLQTEPFGPVPEEAAVYRDALLDGFSDLALRALAEPSAVLVLAGAGGVGRSTQLQQVLSLLGDDIELIAFRARPKVSFEAVDATLRFHLSELGSEDARASLVHLFGERLRAGRVLLLAIDDAHLLASPVLEQLFALRRQLLERLGASARFFLTGDRAFAGNPLPGLDAVADARALRLHLRAFNREQTHAYLLHRLRAAGHPQPERLVKRDLILRLHGSSNGLPKYLNALADDWLEECCEQGESFASAAPAEAPGQAAVSSAPASVEASDEAPNDAMVSAMAALEALRNASRDALEPPVPGAGQRPAQRPDVGNPGAPADQPPVAARRAKTKRSTKKPKARVKAQATPVADAVPVWNRPWFVPGVALFSLFAILIPLVWQLPGSDKAGNQKRSQSLDRSSQNLLKSPLEKPAAQSRQRPPVALGVPLIMPGATASGPQPPLRRELDVPLVLSGESGIAPATAESWGADQINATSSELASPAGEAGVVSGEADASLSIESTESSLPPVESPSPPTGDAQADSVLGGLDRDWILRQSGEAFTIQLAATRSAVAARQHVQGFPGLDVRFVPTRSRSEDFVVILAGAYPARADAERALAELPSLLREQGYWIRSIDSVRQSLRE